ncbi:MAG: hypothetical protein ACR2FY_21320 [Pirellulaceae bacterium]
MNPSLPLLDQISVASPCTVSWDSMQGDERQRYCKLCQKNVYNLSGMRRDEAESLVGASKGRLCVRYYRRHDGTVLTADCPVGLRGVRARLLRGALGIAATMLALAGSLLWGRLSSASSGGRGTGIQALDYGPLSRFSDWVNPRPVLGAMALPPTVPIVPTVAGPTKGNDSAAESAY